MYDVDDRGVPVVRTSDVDRVSAQQGIPTVLAVSACLTNLGVVRAMVESVLLTADFSLSDTADVKLGVDEICTQVMARSSESDSIACSLLIGPGGVVGEITATLRAGLEMAVDGFGWHVVQAVTDSVGIDVDDFDGVAVGDLAGIHGPDFIGIDAAGTEAGRQVSVHFTKVRSSV